MRAGDLHRTGPEIHIGVGVGDDRDQTALFLWSYWNFAQFADDGRIAFVIFVYGHGPVAQHGFGPGGGDGDIVAGLAQGDVAVFVLLDVFVGFPAGEGVFEVPHMAVDFDVFDLKVADRRFEMRVPVDQSLAAIDQPFVIHFHEDFDHGVMEIAGLFSVRRAAGPGHGKGRA